MKKYINMKTIFIVLFILLSSYYMFVKSELYESRTALIVRDMSSSTSTASLGLSLLSTAPNSQLQDSKVVEEYLLSLELFMVLDEKFNLIEHYQSKSLDFIERMSKDTYNEEVLEFYRNRVLLKYDEVSGILHIAYAYTEPKRAQEILNFMLQQVEYELNEFNRRKAKKQLAFIELEHAKNKQRMNISSLKLEEYQNKHLLLDPSITASSSSSIISGMEATLEERKIELSTKETYLNSDNYEILKLKSEINGIKNSLINNKRALTGKGDRRLNKVLFEYEKLKMQFEFDIEVYKNALIQLETVKIDVLKEAKTLSIVSKPNLPDGYTYPNKQKVFITIVIVMLLLYGIFSMLGAIIKDHKE